MYKLRVIAGPNKGTSFAIREGENRLGRLSGLEIVLLSSKVSKVHCTLNFNGKTLHLQDDHSANGTFLNGVLTKKSELKPGDRIGVGKYVLEVMTVSQDQRRPVSSINAHSNVVPFQSNMLNRYVTSGSSALKADHAVGIKPQNLRFEEEVPNDLQGKILHLTENYVLPWLYRFGFEYELKGVLTALFFGAIGLSFLITVIPTVDLAKEKTLAELGRRASFMARQTAEMNAQFLASGFESKVDIGVIKADRTAVFGVLVDMNSRIIAPAEQLNQYLTSGPIAIRVSKISKAMLIDGRETGWVGQVDDLMVAIEPIKTFNPTLQKNIPKALVVVALDTEMSLPQWGAIGTSLSLSILLIGLISTILYFLAYRLILKPIQVLAFDLDKALRGEMNSVTREFKISEMVPVLDLINSVIQRIPKEENGGFSFGSDDHPNKVNVEDLIDSVRGFSEKLNQALLLLNHDGAILFVSTPFEDLSGIRLESSQGQKLSNVGRDQAFGSFIEELLERAKSSGSADDEYEFSGNIYEISVFKMGGATDSPKGYLISAKAKEME